MIFIQAAIAEGKQGLKTDGVLIGSVLVKDKRVQEGDPITHRKL